MNTEFSKTDRGTWDLVLFAAAWAGFLLTAAGVATLAKPAVVIGAILLFFSVLILSFR